MTNQDEVAIQRAVVKYSNGWCLSIPKYGAAPMLFMEWLASFRAGVNYIHKINEPLDDTFSIRMNMVKSRYEEAAQYINDNI